MALEYCLTASVYLMKTKNEEHIIPLIDAVQQNCKDPQIINQALWILIYALNVSLKTINKLYTYCRVNDQLLTKCMCLLINYRYADLMNKIIN